MRAATFLVVLAIHVVFFFVFAVLRSPTRAPGEVDAPATTLIFLPEVVKPVESASMPSPAGRTARLRRAPAPVSSTPQPEPDSASITPPPAPDWRAEAAFAANNVLEAERRKHENPSALQPHDFSGVTPGSTDTSKPRFGWSHAATHRLEGSSGALVLNINDRCAIAVLIVFPFAACRVGKIPVQGNLFEHMYDPPDPKTPNQP